MEKFFPVQEFLGREHQGTAEREPAAAPEEEFQETDGETKQRVP